MEIKWIDIQHRVQYNADVAHKYVKIYCNTNQFPSLPFCGTYSKTHVAKGLSKHYHLRFDPKLGNGVCEIRRIPCAYVECTLMIYKPWISGITSNKQEHYKPVTKCNYWTVMGSFNNWNIILLSHKSTPHDAFDEIHQVVLDKISDNMASLVESVKYGVINTTDTKNYGFYVIIFASEAYIQNNTTIDVKFITYGVLVFNARYICSMQANTNWYWDQHPQQHIITVTTHTILHTLLEVNEITDICDLTKSVCNRTQENNPYQDVLYALLIMTMITS